MIQRVYEAACGCRGLSDVIVATDSDEILDLCKKHGWNARMTSAECRSGTDRVREVARSVSADIYVNVQGDEPLARPEHLDALLSVMKPGVEVGTVYTACTAEDVKNPNAVKIVTALNGRALYFSRATIPFDRDGGRELRYHKHLGFYAYTPYALERFCQWPESELESSERLEQLRFLDHGVDIYAAETPFDTVGVDTEDDLRRVEQILLSHGRV
jgi:3-deoxy-manno-octulosonate cytidylyltransferase (CMP-KDO synthetase)